MLVLRCFIFFVFVHEAISKPALSHRGSHGQNIPPKVQFKPQNDYNKKEISEKINSWKVDDAENVWELSGMFEGDIMLNSEEMTKNGLIDGAKRWPNGTIPVFIQEDDFDQEDILKIKKAINEYHDRTCLVFKAYNESDDDYVVFQGSEPGCWSSVGKQGKGQVINLQNPNCLKHGTIVHEILHAVGFYHQQSATDRDEFVEIHWDNIQPGKEHNFNKYDALTVTDYNVGYDYESVMHYSSKAFSKNGQETISPLKENIKIGQRKKMSKKDLTKLEAMYREECNGREPKNKKKNDGINLNIDFLPSPFS